MALKDKLKTAVQDEKKGATDYTALAEEADTMYPDKGYGSILRDIAREEETHKEHIEAILKDMEGEP